MIENNSMIENSNKNNYDIEIFDLIKEYKLKGKDKKIIALKNINLKVKKGEIFGLLGPNGAGKTTLVSILTTLLQPTSGYAKVLGFNILDNPNLIKSNVGLMLGGDMIYYRLTGYQNLRFFAKIYDIKDYKNKIAELARYLDLTKWMNQYVEKYSKGMKLKLALGRVLLTDPKILFLDEPMLGLDPKSVKKISELLRNLNKTIFLTSHQMNIVQKLCKRIAFLKEGHILKIDTQENFKKLISNDINIRIKVKDDIIKSIKILKTLDFIHDIYKEKDWIYLSIENENNFSELFDHLKNLKIIKFNQIEPDLSDIFIKLS